MPRTVAARRTLALTATTLLALVALLIAARMAGSDLAEAKRARPGAGAVLATQTFQLGSPDQVQRLTAQCPGSKVPLGGGMVTDPPPGPGGEGVYPQSYERLGASHGWHVTAVFVDPSPGQTTTRNVTLQALCSKKFAKVTPPHTRIHINAGQTKSAVATCPGKRRLIGGGFQQTDFNSQGGDYVTESRAISAKRWRVTGHAYGAFGGDLTAIGYCLRSRKPLLTSVSGSTTVRPQDFATARTAPCPAGRRLVFGGFRTTPAGAAFFTNGAMNPDGSWSAGAFADSGQAVNLTAYGYCLRA